MSSALNRPTSLERHLEGPVSSDRLQLVIPVNDGSRLSDALQHKHEYQTVTLLLAATPVRSETRRCHAAILRVCQSFKDEGHVLPASAYVSLGLRIIRALPLKTFRGDQTPKQDRYVLTRAAENNWEQPAADLVHAFTLLFRHGGPALQNILSRAWARRQVLANAQHREETFAAIQGVEAEVINRELLRTPPTLALLVAGNCNQDAMDYAIRILPSLPKVLGAYIRAKGSMTVIAWAFDRVVTAVMRHIRAIGCSLESWLFQTLKQGKRAWCSMKAVLLQVIQEPSIAFAEEARADHAFFFDTLLKAI